MSKGTTDGIQIFLRVRPSKKNSGFVQIDEADNTALNFHVPKNEELYVNNTRENYRYKFNTILSQDAQQEEVFDKVGHQAVMNALDGFNSTIFAYGQTGSGKTFTITGGSERYVDRGIIPRAISMIFNEFKKRSDMKYQCYISYLEIYLESGYDLLDADHETTKLEDMKKVIMREDEDGNYHLNNLSMHNVSSEEDALNCLFLGDTNRAISETDMNQASSRSHCIFTISIEGRKVGSDTVQRSKLHLVDLAGSERVHKTTATGQTIKEAKYINSSLFYLEMVIVALHEKAKKGRSHIPYRNSMMTSVLRDSLGGNCKTVMVATISPDKSNTEESISTCNFAQRVALIKNVAQINEDVDPSLVIRRLKSELSQLREEIKFLKGEAGEGYDLTDEQRDELQKMCEEYVDDRDVEAMLNIGQMTLVKIRDCNAIFKNLVLEARESGEGEGGGLGLSDSELEKQVTTLRNSLQQRDNEIAILVNMVKQGKKIPANFGQGGSDGGGGGAEAEAEAKHAFEKVKGEVKEDKKRGPAKRDLSEKLVCGVKVCFDGNVLDDPAKAFSHFKNLYPNNAALEENKTLLKSKYAEAKKTGEVVNKARNSINYCKKTIEQLRRERAMEGLADGGGGEDYDQEEQIGEEEMEHRKTIEKQKHVYKDNFQKLRELKNAIEHIQRLLEKTRIKMQADFDAWYKVCMYKGGGAAGGTGGEGGGRGYSEAKENIEPPPSAQPKSVNNASAVMPNGAKLTGNKEADDDIVAFYKAKEELLARRGAQSKTNL